MKNKFGKNFINWLKKNKYSFGLSNRCPHCKTFKRKFTNPRLIPKYKGKTRIDYVPATLKGNRVIEKDIDSLYRTFMKQNKRKRKRSASFGGINRKAARITPWPSGSGALSRHDLTPLPGWGKFSMSPGGNRGGNAVNCQDSGYWLSHNRSAPDFPLQRSAVHRTQRQRMRFGNRNLVRRMPKSNTNMWYSKRGIGGFNARSKTIYAPDGNVFTRSYSPYTGARIGGRLPPPYGPIDTAALKGYPNGYETPGGRLTTRKNGFGDVFGTEMDRAQFRPHAIRKWGSNYNSWDNQGLYLKGWNPWQSDTRRTASQRQFAKAAREVNRKWTNNVSFGYSPTLDQMSGPNNVAYRKPFQMYNGGSMLGGNTINWTTRRNYLPPCKGPRVPRLKVQPNNNPTGYLANKNVTPISYARPRNPEILRYGRRKRRARKKNEFGMKPWVARGTTAQRPYTTQMFSSNDASTSGFIRVGQPLELYSYQNNPEVGSYKYPEFSGPRNFYGGFGRQKQKRKQKKKRKRVQKKKVKAGDTLVVKNGKVKVKSNKRTLKRR